MRSTRHSALVLMLLMLAGCADTAPTAPDSAAMRAGPPVSSLVAAAPGWNVGDVAPDLAAFDVDNAPVSLADVAGSFVLLEIGGIWCTPSQALASFMPSLEATFQGEGVPFLTVTALLDGQFPGQVTTQAHAQAWLDAFYSGEYRRVWHMNGDPVIAAMWQEPVDVYDAIPVLILLSPEGEVIRTAAGAGSEAWVTAWIRDGIAQFAGPSIESVAGPTGPISIEAPLAITGTYGPAGGTGLTGSIDWGDGTSSALVLAADGSFSSPAHSWAAAGIYSIEVRITDGEGRSDSRTLPDVTVFDPDGGFVAGAGAVLSPADSCPPEWCAEDENARFNLVAKYSRNSDLPAGAFRFQLDSGAFTFESTAYDWMIIDPATGSAQIRGTGTVNGLTGEEWQPGAVISFTVVATDALSDSFVLAVSLETATGEEYAIYIGEVQAIAQGNVMVNTGR